MARTADTSGSSALQRAQKLLVRTWRKYRSIGFGGKAFIWFTITLITTTLVVFFTIGPKTIFQKLYDFGQVLHDMRFGWMIIVAIAIVCSFPPLIGYSTSITLSGFAYGPVYGFLIIGPSSVVGSAIVFSVLRALFKERIASWTRSKKKWQALEQVIEARGTFLICLIRLCPIPWVYSNAFFASIEAVALWQFVIATCCLLPKIWVLVFLGSQLANLSDGTTREEMTPMAKALNIISIVVGTVVAAGTGWFVWRLTEEKIKHMEGLSPEVDEEAADALDEAARPLLVQALSSNSQNDDDEEEAQLDAVVNDLIDTGAPRSNDRTDSLV